MNTINRTEIRQRFLKVDSANVADVLDEMGLLQQTLHSALQSYVAGAGKIAGFAYTIFGETTSYPNDKGDPEKMQACNGISENEIAVWSGDGKGTAYFGELIALGMQERGCVGALVNGGVRDCEWLIQHNFSVSAKYKTPLQSVGRWKVTTWQKPIELPGALDVPITVYPGDFILSDIDGVIVIPNQCILEVLEKTELLTKKELDIREALSRGMNLSTALKQFGSV